MDGRIIAPASRMHRYVDVYFSPNGLSPLEVADRIRKMAGLSSIVDRHDLVFERSSVPEFRERLGILHAALQGTGVQYGVESVVDYPTFVEPTPWPHRSRGIPASTPRIRRTSRRANRTRDPHPPAASGTTRPGYQPSPAGSTASRSRVSRIRGSIGFLAPVP